MCSLRVMRDEWPSNSIYAGLLRDRPLFFNWSTTPPSAENVLYSRSSDVAPLSDADIPTDIVPPRSAADLRKISAISVLTDWPRIMMVHTIVSPDALMNGVRVQKPCLPGDKACPMTRSMTELGSHGFSSPLPWRCAGT